MKILRHAMLAAVALVALAACKNDSEEDILPPADADYTGVVLNEVCGGSRTDDADDWVELRNNATSPVNLAGVQIVKTDEEGASETIYTFPAGVSIAQGEYKVVSKAVGELSAKISNSKEVTISLVSPSGNENIDVFDRDATVGEGHGHELGGSYARVPDAMGAWKVVAVSTPGAENVDESVPEPKPNDENYEGLALNELNGNDPKYIELYNASDAEMDITGVQIRKDGGEIVYVAPEGTKIAAKGFLTLLADQTDYASGFTSGLSAKKSLLIELLDPAGAKQLDVFKNKSEAGGEKWGEKDPLYNGDKNGDSYARFPDGSGKWYMSAPTQDAPNAQGDTEIVW